MLNANQINLIPLAGAGSRFVKEGYKDPKPLIPVDNTPMIIRAVNDLPPADDYVFIVRTEHINNYSLKEILEKKYPGCTIIDINYLTEGQASTCLLAKDYINNDKALLIGACDNGAVYNKQAFQDLIADKSVDAVIFTFRNNVTVIPKPEAYGWVKVADDGKTVTGMSVKVPISYDPLHDHAVVGAFWFRQGKYFVEAAEDMIAHNTRIKGEYYVDECLNNVVQMGLNVQVFETDKYICWGTPDDLRTYNYWKSYFKEHHNGKA